MISRRQHFLDNRDTTLDRLCGATDVLHVVARQPITFLQTFGAKQRRDLVRLTAEADKDRRRNLGWRASPAIVPRSTSMLSPMSMPQPVPCVSAITP